MNSDLVTRLRSFFTYVRYESVDGAYEMASVCQQAADEIERLRERVAELENDDLVITGPDGAELCRFSGSEATEIINLAVSLLVETAIKRISNDG